MQECLSEVTFEPKLDEVRLNSFLFIPAPHPIFLCLSLPTPPRTRSSLPLPDLLPSSQLWAEHSWQRAQEMQRLCGRNQLVLLSSIRETSVDRSERGRWRWQRGRGWL